MNGNPRASKVIVVFEEVMCNGGFFYFTAPVKGLVRSLKY